MCASLRRRTVAGVIWAGIDQFGSLAIHYIVLLVLAWLLSPVDFGLIGLAMIFILFSQAVGELGMAAAIVQQKEITEPALSTAFWTNLMVSLLLTAVTYANAEQITSFLGDAAAAPLLKVLAIIFPITALVVVPRALLEKELSFRRLTIRGLASEVAFGLVGLTMAIMGAGVWSLVGAAIAQRLGSAAMLWFVVPWRPRLEFDLSSLRRLLPFGLQAMSSLMLSRGLAHADYFIVGRWLGTEALGYYTLAFQLAIVPQQRLVGVLRKVAFPAFSIVQDDLHRLKTGFLESIQHLFVVLVPISLFLVVLGPWFIRGAYGEKWLPSIQPLQVLALAGLFYGFDVAEALYFAIGQPRVWTWVIGLRFAFFIILVAAFGLRLGIVGVAISLSLSVVMTSFVNFVAVSRITNATWQTLLQPVWLALRAALLACLPFAVFSFFPAQGISPWVVLIGLGFAMALTYGLAVIPAYRVWLGRVSTEVLRDLRR